MNAPIRNLLVLFSGACLTTLLGCGEGKPSVESATTEATVKGTVRIKGAPAKGGEVVFDPSNYLRKDAAPRNAQIKPDGTYEIKTLTGVNQVSLTGPAAAALPEAQFEKLEFDVKAGDNTFDVELPKH